MALYRVEDRRLLTGRGAFVDDLEPVANLHHAAVVRSPHAHARIRGVDASEALAMPGVVAVMTGEDVRRACRPFTSALPRQAPYYPCAVDRARFVGEPVAVVVAESRYLAEDAAARVRVDYEPLPAVVDPERAVTDPEAPLLHEDVGSNVALHRLLDYGDVDAAWAEADVTVRERFVFPKYGSQPLETYGVIADWNPAEEVLTLWSNFHGPFSMHPVVAQALGLASNRLRFVVPADVGGGFGIKTSIYPYLALIGLAARHAGVPVKWIADRREDLAASSSSTDRVSYVEAAARRDGTILGFRMTIYDDVGGYFRPPEPGCIFRPLGNYVGGYAYRNLRVDGYCCFTNRSLTGPNRGYGCQELYFGVERVVDLLAERLGMDPVELRRRNLIPRDAFPYVTPTGGVYDAGDYEACLDKALEMADYAGLRRRQAEARAAGRLFGIGVACGVDPSVSNMGYVDIAATPEERARRRPKSGATQATTIQVDDLGKVTVELSTCPQGQSHETMVRRFVARELGVPEEDVSVVSGMDTATRAWTVPTGSYSSRFASIGISSAVVAARRVREKLARIAAHQLEARVEDLELSDGVFRVKGSPQRGFSLRHAAGVAHWDPASLPEGMEPGVYLTHYHTMPTARPPDAGDRVNSSNTYGFMFDVCAVEIDPETGEVEILKYVTAHDSGVILDHLIAEGQVRGSFVHGLGGAMYEEMAYAPDGAFLSGTFMDYLCPTFMEVPPLEIGHVEVPSPFTVLGSKGLGESSTETVPVCVANAVSDALRPLGIEVNELPVTPSKVWRRMREAEGAKRAW
jgi:2-furoyl-CoA dehydrogenase large subunit